MFGVESLVTNGGDGNIYIYAVQTGLEDHWDWFLFEDVL